MANAPRNLKKMPTPGAIGPGQTATINLPLGLTYNFFLIYANWDNGGTDEDVAVADWGNVIDEIRLMVNGDARITIDAADLVKLNSYYGQSMVAGTLPLFLSRPWMRTIGGEDLTGYGTIGIDTFTLEMDIKAGVTVNKLEVTARQSAPTMFGPHLRIQKYVRNQGVTGPAEIDNIVRGNYAMLAMHIGTASIGKLEVHADQQKLLETTAPIRSALYAMSKRNAQAGMTHVDFHIENRMGETLPMALQDFRLQCDFTATGSFPIYAESMVGGIAA